MNTTFRIRFYNSLFMGLFLFVGMVACHTQPDQVQRTKPADIIESEISSGAEDTLCTKASIIRKNQFEESSSITIDSCIDYFKAKNFELVACRHWSSSYFSPEPTSRDSVIELPRTYFAKGMFNQVIQALHIHSQHIDAIVLKGQGIDFKVVQFSYPDSVTAIADQLNIQAYSRFVLHAHSRIKHPNYFFRHRNSYFYFETRAAMFSDKLIPLMYSYKKNLQNE